MIQSNLKADQDKAGDGSIVSRAVWIFRYIIVYWVILGVGCFLFFKAAKRYPVYTFSAAAIFTLQAVIRVQLDKIRDRKRGWRVGHTGRDTTYYEELRGGVWQGFELDGEMLTGRKAHRIIYFTSTTYPEWTNGRREEIIRRIKSEFQPPGYEYLEGEPYAVANAREPFQYRCALSIGDLRSVFGPPFIIFILGGVIWLVVYFLTR